MTGFSVFVFFAIPLGLKCVQNEFKWCYDDPGETASAKSTRILREVPVSLLSSLQIVSDPQKAQQGPQSEI